MIRLSKTSDINDIILLWNEAFGDTAEDIKFFLDEKYLPNNTVVYECDGKVVSVLFLLEGEMHINEVDYPSFYLYAACTLKAYRGRGIMSELLEYAALISGQRQKYFIALKPAEESLYNYYSKFGYKTVYYKNIVEINSCISNQSNDFSCPVNSCDYSFFRNNAFSDINYFKWDKKSVDFAIRHHKHFGGEILSFDDGYILYSKINDTIHVKESTFFSVDKIIRLLNSKISTGEFDSIQIDLPYIYNQDNCKIVNSGMLLALNSDANKIIENLNSAYLNLTLD